MKRLVHEDEAPEEEEQLLTQLLQVNARLEQETIELLHFVEQQEKETLSQMHALQQRVAWKRMQQAVGQLDESTSSRHSRASDDALQQLFDWHNKTRHQRERESREICNSLLRPRRSFFSERLDPKFAVTTTAKRDDKRFDEPEPNEETRVLRSHCNESFHLVPFTKFSPQERTLLKQFVTTLQQDESFQQDKMDLSKWNRVQQFCCNKKQLRRSGFECFLWWQLHENPKVRRAAWTKQEDEVLRKLAESQTNSGDDATSLVNNWQEIAKRLPFPGRLPVHCLIRYQTVLNKRALQGEFTPEEDTFLRQAVEIFGEKFNIIADLMDGRVAEQLYTRWHLTLSPDIRQGFWSAVEERRLLLALYCYHGQHTLQEESSQEPARDLQEEQEAFDISKVSFADLAFHIPGRHGSSIRDHLVNSMNLQVTFTKFSKQEDTNLLELMRKLGGPLQPRIWSRIAKEMGNRSDSQIRKRWAMLAPLEYQKFVQEREVQSKTPALFSRVSKRKRCRQDSDVTDAVVTSVVTQSTETSRGTAGNEPTRRVPPRRRSQRSKR